MSIPTPGGREESIAHPENRLPLPREEPRREPGGEPRAPGDIFNKALEILRKDFPSPPKEGLSEKQPLPPRPPEMIPARMLNEFVYCPRLFYYEFVEGVFMESADTLRGSSIHSRVDSGNGSLPPATRPPAEKHSGEEKPGEAPADRKSEPEIIHSRSVQMGSESLQIVAKMDLVETRLAPGGPLSNAEVCPVDYKAGAPREAEEANDLWDTDKMQLGLQALILRENGYICNEGIIYYRQTRQRVRLPITTDLQEWILHNIQAARRAIQGPIPPPLINSPKCARCSLAPVCLPDETRMLLGTSDVENEVARGKTDARSAEQASSPRRLIAARDDVRTLYLNTQGLRVGCKSEVLQIKERDKLVEEIRMCDLSHVALFGNIQISTQAIQVLCELEIPVTYFSMGGWFYGITRGHGLKNVFLRMEQFRLAREPDFSLSLARKIVHGKIRNHRTLLMRNHVEAPESILLKLKRASGDALEARSLDELLGIEGAAASQYFQEFGGMIKTGQDEGEQVEAGKGSGFDFNFATRNRRPPADPVNAMLSLAYSLLSKDCTLAALAVGFDPYVGFYHQPRFGRPALALDLMEEFRPLIAESTVLSCINNRVVTEGDFVRAGKAVNLSAACRKKFFQMYEQRMNSLIIHPLFEYKVSYRRAVELQARLLGKTLTGEIEEYIPFMTR